MNNPYNEFAIQIYIGEKRSGKTLSMVAETYERIIKYNPSIPVYANFILNKKYFPNSHYIKKKDLEEIYKNKDEYTNCIFLIDEMHIFLDARNFMKKGNKLIGYFVGQMGKRGNILKGNTHFPQLVDYRLRLYCERYIFVRKGIEINNFDWKPIINNNRELTPDENRRLKILNEPIIRKLVNYDFQDIKEAPFYVKGEKYFGYYDTEEFITGDEDEE